VRKMASFSIMRMYLAEMSTCWMLPRGGIRMSMEEVEEEIVLVLSFICKVMWPAKRPFAEATYRTLVTQDSSCGKEKEGQGTTCRQFRGMRSVQASISIILSTVAWLPNNVGSR